MKKVELFKAIAPTGHTKANAAADISLINQFARKKLAPEDVYVFSMTLADNSIDRDDERFTNECLKGLAPLFLGKTVLIDHNWSAEKQIARLYRVKAVDGGGKNSLGEPLMILDASAYMLNNESNQPIIDAIEGGILREVSVGCAINSITCSICRKELSYSSCPDGHRKGQTYNGKLCFGELSDPTDAYELSFVAVPAQPGAGVTKGASKSTAESTPQIDPAEFKKMSEMLERMLIIHQNEVRMKNNQTESEKTAMQQTTKKSSADITPDITAKAAFYTTVIGGGDRRAVCEIHKALGALPTSESGSALLPTGLAQTILTQQHQNPLRLVEPLTTNRGLVESTLLFDIEGTDIESITDAQTAKEIELSAGRIEYGRFKAKISAPISDTVLHGSNADIVEAVEGALLSGLAIDQMMTAFRTDTDGEHDHASFYLCGIIPVTGPDILRAIINAAADLPQFFRDNATCIMRSADYYAAVTSNGMEHLWGAAPENVLGLPVMFCDYAAIPIVGDFAYSRQNYDPPIGFDSKAEAKKGLVHFVLTAWGDHRIRLKSAFRLAKVED